MDKEKILSELTYKAVRSSGAGGQNVNKVSSKVVLSFDLAHSAALTDDEKMLAGSNLAPKLTNDKILVLHCDEDRSRLRNKEIVTRRFLRIIDTALKVQKTRKATKVPKAVIKKRIENKRRQSEIKQSRRKPDY
ncbi:aminoacyl-tRNA hydrolase [Flavobacterium cyanobacteriorum]|uniref:Aminoacyl-tRNA hydrolase n=1 Tax=Flavobacterium cyanobacteriorum TaxID=2022802 RepID=A0A255ZAX5_9FLAO|nr:alternative ribosome rescue aminoacyl-tRNA hydrolase ArfB [Flavobacterium cyanobacteriorum]OYQ38638.1 aminoacyl-tRNA hydrolase [Flavobacterium cyanobacteriorum]